MHECMVEEPMRLRARNEETKVNIVLLDWIIDFIDTRVSRINARTLYHTAKSQNHVPNEF